jgi:hypothetical protein
VPIASASQDRHLAVADRIASLLCCSLQRCRVLDVEVAEHRFQPLGQPGLHPEGGASRAADDEARRDRQARPSQLRRLAPLPPA